MKLQPEATRNAEAGENPAEECCGKNYNLLLKQILANIGPMLMNTSNGMVGGYSAILLPQLKHELHASLVPTKSEHSWIASMAPLQMAMGCVFSGWSMDRFGRKPTTIASGIFATTGWLIIYFATTINQILIGRFVTGFTVGYSGLCMTCYIGEVSHPQYRGFFLNTITLGSALGALITHSIGIFLNWRTTALITTILPVSSLIFMCFVPESPVWYMNQNKLQKSKEAYIWLRGNRQDELQKLLDDKAKSPLKKETFTELLNKCKNNRFLRPFSILLLLFTIAQLTGNNAIVFYSVDIMQSAVAGVDKYASMIIVDTIRVAMSLVACILIKKYKVRPLAMISGIGTVTSLFSLSLFIHLSTKFPENKLFAVMPLFNFITYIICMSIGLIPICWALCGEILPPETKGIGGGISSTVNFLVSFMVVKTNPDLIELIGASGTFATYGIATFIGTVLLYFFLPETRGKTLEEIQEQFDRTKRKCGSEEMPEVGSKEATVLNRKLSVLE